ncbi:chalcone isomerase family protein [Denitratisoma oestradiolicum]|uniref:Chalcone isomerase domain-containing protein n=1 Tax=Denitratisoma oestradiolicum TaxID=311182 RepID=A0A6S6Y0T3_9PROT|nr:chalcone isomerase family protein [Denitratisoma oestradiolicum]TWO80774.1 hypothetical protein CBW56_08405 [Denitratisoma oestradiolicum]CAB1370913.1 conserved exported protein of unknown function [Denitratisoma oestradiolicum]
MTRIKKFLRQASLLLPLLGMTPSSLQAVEVAGVKVEDRLTAQGATLQLNGAGLRTKMFFKVYVAALYVTKPSTSSRQLLEAPEPSRMVLQMLRDVDADTLFNSLRDGLRANVPEAELVTLQAGVDQLGALMATIGQARSGDTIVLDLDMEKVVVSHNGEVRGQVAAPRLGRALLSIWLGEHPVDDSLKKALLRG